MRYWTARLGQWISAPGLLVGTLFFIASLTPSLIPRTYWTQGALSGVSLAAGYGVGVFAVWLCDYLELPGPDHRTQRKIKLVTATVCVAAAVLLLWQASQWQSSIRVRMELEPVENVWPFRIGLIALAGFGALYALGRIFQFTALRFSGWLKRHIPRRISNAIGVIVTVALFWLLIDGVLIRYGLRAVDLSFQQFDAMVESGIEAPTNSFRAGSAASLIDWEDLGRAGRRFVSSGPRRGRIAAFTGKEAREPIRVYVGLNAAETVEERAKLALEELKRTDAFDRSILIIATPTGTGTIDPGAMNTVEYLHHGDVASVAVQYSYLSSWLSLLVEPGYGAETARALFAEIYDYWTELPKESRPKLFLHGLSLGALNSQLSADLFDVIGDPFQGALWSGPPFSSATWRFATQNRRPSSPVWLPRFRDDSIIRFTNQWNGLDIQRPGWGPVRIVYLQYASDPVTFFDPRALYREPEWMRRPRGPDVSPQIRWFPIVTLLQLMVDMASAQTSPLGYGHAYAPKDYIDAWIAVAAPEGWSKEEIRRLKRIFAWRK